MPEQAMPVTPPSSAATSEQERPAAMLRPGVFVPDWQEATAEPACQVLDMIFGCLGKADRLSGLRPDEDRIWRAVQESLVLSGAPADVPSIAEDTGFVARRVEAILQQLQERDLVVLDGGTTCIIGCYPFSLRDTGHRVQLSGGERHAMCAIDALGMGAMIDLDTAIASSCRHCGTPITVRTADKGRTLASVSPESAVVWVGFPYAASCAATSLCRVMAFFCSDAHLADWRAEAGPEAPGVRLAMEEGLQVGRAIFGPILRNPSNRLG